MTAPPTLTTLDASEPLEKIYDVIAREGGVIIKDFISPELLNETMMAMEPHFSARGNYASKSTHEELGQGFFPEGSIRVYALLARIPDQVSKIMQLPIWQGIMARFLKWVSLSFSLQQWLLCPSLGYC